ncbi:hypothetical protein RCL1_008672 [Eukaryota sp. TZLM3-RCL]
MTSALAMPRQRHQPPPAATPPSASGPVCSYCKQPGHAIESCPDPSCNRSKLRKSGDPPSGKERAGTPREEPLEQKDSIKIINIPSFCLQPFFTPPQGNFIQPLRCLFKIRFRPP